MLVIGGSCGFGCNVVLVLVVDGVDVILIYCS